jgi:hypothetical protein
MYLYELITFGPVLAIEHHQSPRKLGVGDIVRSGDVDLRVERLELVDGSPTRLICVEAQASNPPLGQGGKEELC